MTRARGFCDLNIPANVTDLKATVLKALSIGYQTIAINQYVSDTMAKSGEKDGGSKKRKRPQATDEALIPPPVTVKLSELDFQRNKITREPLILTRITITHSDPSSPFLSKYANSIRQYDLIAIVPENDATLKQIVWSKLVDVDIISLAPDPSSLQLSRSLLKSAVERDIYFELCYSPCLTDFHVRKQTLILSHYLHRASRSGNIILTSRANSPQQLRHPYDVMNVGRFLGLSELATKSAMGNTAHNAIYCSMARRKGLSKCAVQITVLGKESENAKYEGLADASEFLNTVCGVDGQVKKKKKKNKVPVLSTVLSTVQIKKDTVSKKVKKRKPKHKKKTGITDEVKMKESETEKNKKKTGNTDEVKMKKSETEKSNDEGFISF